MPTVINRHHYKASREYPKPWIYIGRGTALGNPYRVDEVGRDRCLQMYKRWLWHHIKDPHSEQACALRSIRPEHHLVCSCAPRPCHGDVIVAAWEWQRRNEGRDQCPPDSTTTTR